MENPKTVTKLFTGVFTFLSLSFLVCFSFALAGVIVGFEDGEKNDGETQGETDVKPTLDPNTETFKIIDVVDGDTVKFVYDGKTETARLIGIDTPESVHPQKPVECYALEASNKLKELVEGKDVVIEFDPSQGNQDKYGRLLIYIKLPQNTGILNVNEFMIKEGFAFEYTYSKPYKYQKEFKAAQGYARDNKVGLWSQTTCNGKVN